ncbi:MAG: UTP--glucose-1-phosphate uridylyltransferase [Rhizobiales bacterium TMED143]|nr:UTP--glucose-1-phosphate uridylyltransferase [Rhodobiaceae bacterium]OUV93440.1 MAG: UTP--glucose-1-phosphate uridylyltransferase [Rhizobiales bacterium TMED143]
MAQTIRKVVFPVAGLGTRFLPATKAVPKEMLPVVDRPLIQWAIEEAAAAGCTEFIFVTSPHKRAILEHFSPAPAYEEALTARGKDDQLALLQAGLPETAKITEVYQDQPLGLGHAIWCAHEAVGDEPFAVILPDDMVLHKTGCLSQMVKQYEEVGGNLVAVETVPREHTSRYGVLNPGAETGPLVEVKGLVEKPSPEAAPSTLAIIGRYILDPSVMEDLSQFNKGAGGEIQITDTLARLIGSLPLHGFRFDGRRFDCGNRAGFLAANLAYALSPNGAGDQSDLGENLRPMLQSIIDAYSAT